MLTLEATFEQRLASAENQDLIANLGSIVVAHEAYDRELTPAEVQRTHRVQWMSRFPQDRFTSISRTIGELTAHHGVTPGQLRDFAADGTVVDVGPGRSPFLDMFNDDALTIAVDLDEDHIAYQVEKGRQGIVAPAHDSRLRPGIIRLLHAAYSAPFWSASPEESTMAADEYLRVLEPGGIALVGPYGRKDEHEHYEYTLQYKLKGGRKALPWSDPEDAPLSRIRTAFYRRALELKDQGEVELVGTRYITQDEVDYRRGTSQLHVPNYLMIRRAA
jgi:hypothetical protein